MRSQSALSLPTLEGNLECSPVDRSLKFRDLVISDGALWGIFEVEEACRVMASCA